MKGLGRILSVAILWAVTGTIAGWGLQTFIGVDGLLLSCGSLNVAIGMALLQITTLSEEGRNLFYEGKNRMRIISISALFLCGDFRCSSPS